MNSDGIVRSEETKQRIHQAFRVYWLSPLCPGIVQLGETLVGWALQAALTGGKAYADAFNLQTKTAYQIKTGLRSSPVTFARLTTSSQLNLVNTGRQNDANLLGAELLAWVWQRINQPREVLGAEKIRVARIIYSRLGQFTYYERDVTTDPYDPNDFVWRWSSKGKALEGFYKDRRWFSWYPQGRLATRNQNQLHFHGENDLIPKAGAPNRYDFNLGEPAQVSFDKFMTVVQPLFDALPNSPIP